MAIGAHRSTSATGFRAWLFPRTLLGWSSVALAVGVPGFYALAMLAGALGMETSDFAPAVVGPLALATISALAALIVGCICVASGEDRAVLVFASAAIALLFMAVVLWSFLSPSTGHPPVGPPAPPPTGP